MIHQDKAPCHCFIARAFPWERPSKRVGLVFSGANRPVAHTAHTQDMSMRKIGQRTKPEHMAALNTVRKAICVRCVKLSDHKNEFCHFSYAKTLYQMHTLFFSRPIYSTRWPANGSVQSVTDELWVNLI